MISVRKKILAYLAKNEATTDDLARELVTARSTVASTLKDLRKEKKIRIRRYAYTGAKPVAYWGLGEGDAPRPAVQTLEERNARKREWRRLAKEQAQKLEEKPEFKPRRDIAASWF